MDKVKICGGNRIKGEIKSQGAKNSVLPILAATLLFKGESVIKNCPDLKDVNAAIDILRHLGCTVKRENDIVIVNAEVVKRCDIPDFLMREMRSSVIFLGAIIARCGEAQMSFPGGCELGPRPIDIHLSALSELGVLIKEDGGRIFCKAGNMRGKDLCLSFPSVGATENIILAATACSEGVTRIINAAKEPEIGDLIAFISKMGIRCFSDETTVAVNGGRASSAPEHTVMPDRIAAATYLCAAAATGGEIDIRKAEPAHISTVIRALLEAGCSVKTEKDSVRLKAKGRLRAINTVRTMPYPGFPTDAQAQLMATLLKAEGTTLFVENIFENRYRHVDELLRMGANIKTVGKVAMVTGVDRLSGAKMHCTDLRGGASLVIAALSADGESEIYNLHHIDRGYQDMWKVLSALGAEIKKEGT